MKKNNITLRFFLTLSLALFLAIVGQNIYDSLYPPLYSPPKIDEAEVRERIEKSGLTPREAMHYKEIEIDTRRKPQEEKEDHGQDQAGTVPALP